MQCLAAGRGTLVFTVFPQSLMPSPLLFPTAVKGRSV